MLITNMFGVGLEVLTAVSMKMAVVSLTTFQRSLMPPSSERLKFNVDGRPLPSSSITLT
jgi:hypothetical protein